MSRFGLMDVQVENEISSPVDVNILSKIFCYAHSAGKGAYIDSTTPIPSERCNQSCGYILLYKCLLRY